MKPREMDSLLFLGLSVGHGDSAETRESIALGEDGGRLIWDSLKCSETDPVSIVYLQTCHRVELYSWGIPIQKIYEAWESLLGRPSGLRLMQKKIGIEGLTHFVRVAASLDSEVLGETQIMGQTKDAIERSRSQGTLRGPLDKLLQHGIKVSKQIRTEAKIGEGNVSVAHVALEGLRDTFDSFEDKKILLVGVGRMATQSLEKLLTMGAEKIYWTNRTEENLLNHPRASDERIQRIPFRERHHWAWAADIIVSAVNTPTPIFSAAELVALGAQRGSIQEACRGLTRGDKRNNFVIPSLKIVIDLGLPRNFDPLVHGRFGYLIRNVDEFRNEARENFKIRSEGALRAEEILQSEIENFRLILRRWHASKEMSELFSLFNFLDSEEGLEEVLLEKSSKIGYKLGTVYGHLMHRLKREIEGLSEEDAQVVLETLVRAWRQPETWLQKRGELKISVSPKESKA